MHKKQLGEWGEKKALNYLKNKGYKILSTNYSTKIGEIDLIAANDQCLIFVEVKTRKDKQFGLPQVSVDEKKQKKIKNVACCYLQENKNKYTGNDLRFDVIAIIKQKNETKIDHIINAF